MRLWSIHPKYLDARGLVALWREGLLAQKVLAGKTRGYKNHPQLERFKGLKNPLQGIGLYLTAVAEEAKHRGYRFDLSKIILTKSGRRTFIKVTRGQLRYETEHLKAKLLIRDPELLGRLSSRKIFTPHPSFKAVSGSIASWEKIS